jgi:hypothetical protein
MKRLLIILAVLVMVASFVCVVLPYFARAKVYSGPGIYGNLRYIQLAKDQWVGAGNTNEWPTAENLFPRSSPAKSFQEIVRPRYGELYFINRTGAPPFAYFPKAARQYSAGDILFLTTTGLTKVQQ